MMDEKDSTKPISSRDQDNPGKQSIRREQKGPGDLKKKVIPLHPRNDVTPEKSKDTRSEVRRVGIPKQPHKKVTIRRDATAKKKKKKEPISYKYFRRKSGSFLSNYWEIIVTILLAVIFAIYILPRFLQ
jgi:hypothetical protein